MAEKPKHLIIRGLDISRTSVLVSAQGEIIHPSMVKPNYIPAEPYKAATRKVQNDTRPAVWLQHSAISDCPTADVRASVTAAPMSGAASAPQVQEAAEARPKPVNIVDPIMSGTSLTKECQSTCDGSSRTRDGAGSEISSQDDTGQSTSTCHSMHGDLSELAVRYNKQLQINAELKRLLIASVGSDLHTRLEQLTEDKIALSSAVGEFSRRRLEDYEDLDRVSIQADMWRSKYLATKLMADDLVKERRALARQCTLMASALQELLHERPLIHSALHMANQFLHKMADKATSQQHLHNRRGTPSSLGKFPRAQASDQTTIGLSEEILDSVEIVARLQGVSLQAGKKEIGNSSFSPAELIAYQQLQVLHGSPPVVIKAAAAEGTIAETPLVVAAAEGPPAICRPARVLPRFHKLARYDGAMYFGCQKCTGELHIV